MNKRETEKLLSCKHGAPTADICIKRRFPTTAAGMCIATIMLASAASVPSVAFAQDTTDSEGAAIISSAESEQAVATSDSKDTNNSASKSDESTKTTDTKSNQEATTTAPTEQSVSAESTIIEPVASTSTEATTEDASSVPTTELEATANAADVQISAEVHVQDIGWTSAQPVGTDEILELGTTGQSLRMEALTITLEGEGLTANDITYQVHVANLGWQDWVSEGYTAGTTGQSLSIEAIRIKLSDDLASKYDIYYKSHIADYGWLDWACNGSIAGSTGLSKRLEALQIVLTLKNSGKYTASDDAYKRVIFATSSHVQYIGWTSQSFVNGDIVTIGTTGQGLRLEAFTIALNDANSESGLTGGISYQAHVANYGWQNVVQDGVVAGTTGQGTAVEAATLSLYGGLAQTYNLYIRAHVANIGWLDWVLSESDNKTQIGTVGFGRQAECLQLYFVRKGQEGPNCNEVGASFVDKANPLVKVVGGVLSDGEDTWRDVVEGQTSGTVGLSKSLTAMKLSLDGQLDGSINYSTHLSNVGWTSVVSNGAESGNESSYNAIEAIQIYLSGMAANIYDVWYCVHEANIGWMGWAADGAYAGTSKLSYHTEAIQVVLVLKGSSAPGSTDRPYVDILGYAQNCEYIDQNPELPWGCESVALTVVLRAMGYDINKTLIADQYLDYSDWDFVNCYAGDPYNETGLGVCMPPAIVNAANKFLSEHGSSMTAQNLTGASFDALMQYVTGSNIPVIVWTTMYGSDPVYNGQSLYGYNDYYNEHCIVVCGCDYGAGTVTVCDSLNGKVVRNIYDFAALHAACGNMAVVIA